jgi:hypothetical protein
MTREVSPDQDPTEYSRNHPPTHSRVVKPSGGFFARPSGGWRLGCWWMIVLGLALVAFKIVFAIIVGVTH